MSLNKVLKFLLFSERPSSTFSSVGILGARLITGLSMILHGLPKLQAPFSWLGPDVPALMQGLAVFAEVGGGLGILIGLLFPLASFGVFSTMVTAVLLGHVKSSDPLFRITVSLTNEGEGTQYFGLPLWFARAGGHSNGGSGSAELAILLGSLAFILFFVGAGRFSLDHFITKRLKKI